MRTRWVEGVSAAMTLLFTVGGWVAVTRVTVFVATKYFADMGTSLPAPTQYVVDLALEPLRLQNWPVLLPALLCALGVTLNARRERLGAVLLVGAPSMALLEVLAAVVAISLPLVSIAEPLRADAPEFEIAGRVVDSDGAPVEGARVELFADRETVQGFSLNTRPSDDGKDCVNWPLVCSADTARAEALRRLNAGTLTFPKPLANTVSDANGRFFLLTTERDAQLTASKGSRFARTDSGSRWRDATLTLEPTSIEALRIPQEATGFTIVNPFTRTSGRYTADTWNTLEVPVEGATIWFDSSAAPRTISTLELRADGGLVDGLVELDCGNDRSMTLHTDGGLISFELLGENDFCRARVSTPNGFANRHVGASTRVLDLLPKRPLTVTWSPAGVALLRVDYPPSEGIGGIGTRGGGTLPGGGEFDGGRAHFDTLDVKPDITDLIVTLEQPGFRSIIKRFDPTKTSTVALTLTPEPGTTGRVVDSQRRAADALVLELRTLDGGYLGHDVTDARGFFGFSPSEPGPLVVIAFDPLRGSLAARTDQHDGGVLLLTHAEPVELKLDAEDGGTFAGQRVTVTFAQGEFRMRVNDAGVVRFTGLPAGNHHVNVTADDRRLGDAELSPPRNTAVLLR